jgi:superfamily II DNA or RNA helicase
MWQLFAHQQRAIEKAISGKRIIVIRPLGSGKTAIGLHIAQHVLATAPGPAMWVAPAHLLPQLVEEKQRWSLFFPIEIVPPLPQLLVPGVLYAMSYDRFRLSHELLRRTRWKLLIVDEFQHAKNPTTQNHHLLKSLGNEAEFFVGMTGAPFQNSPYEFFNLVALVAGKPIQRKLERCLAYKYERKYSFFVRWITDFFGMRPNRGPITGIRDPSTLGTLLRPHLDYSSPRHVAGECGLPNVISEIVRVEMNPSELGEYRTRVRTHRKLIDRKFFQDDLEEEAIERGFTRVADLRQALLHTARGPSSKVLALCQHVKKIVETHSAARIVVFTNFVERGVRVISDCLSRLNVRHAAYTGGAKIDTKVQAIESFKWGTTPVLILSPVGFEGLNLSGTTHVFVADPHYNPEVTAQLVARATRAGSSIPEVHVFHYLSYSSKLEKGTIDEIILRISQRKAFVNDMIQKVLESFCETSE